MAVINNMSLWKIFEDFRRAGYLLKIDALLEETRRAFIDADIFVTAKSAFSEVPVILRLHKGDVLKAPFKHFHAMPHWNETLLLAMGGPEKATPVVVDDAYIRDIEQKMLRLQKKLCPKQGIETDYHKYMTPRQNAWLCRLRYKGW